MAALPRVTGKAILIGHVMLVMLAYCHVAASESTDCEALGFTGLGLCSSCNLLAEHVKDAELEADCRKCCTTDDDDDSDRKKTFASAILEVCMRRVGFYPTVVRFIEDKAASYRLLTVRYRAHAAPKLVMMDQEGEIQDTVMIDSWRLEHIEGFLQEKLKAPE